jgi:hypothetical protein
LYLIKARGANPSSIFSLGWGKSFVKRQGCVQGGNMARKLNIGVLLVDTDSGVQIGVIKFDSSGMLIYQIVKPGVQWFAFKPIEGVLKEKWIKQPLYKKHAKLLDKNKNLPQKVLVQEAKSCSECLNSLKIPPKLGRYTVKAEMVRW